MKWFRKEEDGHRHRWAPIEVKHGTIETLVTSGTQIAASTQILLLCECGEYSTQTIHGHWELKEVRHPWQGADRELEELRKMAGLNELPKLP